MTTRYPIPYSLGESSEEGTTFRSVPLQQTLARPTVLPTPSVEGWAPIKSPPVRSLPQKPSVPVSATSPIPTWSVDESDLPAVESLQYPLERQALPVKGRFEDIKANVMTVLHKQGVSCRFPSHQDDMEDEIILPGRIDCTHGELKFVLQLYSQGGSGNFVLEVQRRAGSSVELHGLRRPLFQSLLGKRSASAPPRMPSASKRRFPPPLRC